MANETSRLFRPAERGKRDPLSNQKQNGFVANPPRFAEIGNLDGPRKGFHKNDKNIRKPGTQR